MHERVAGDHGLGPSLDLDLGARQRLELFAAIAP
jgi:hypothetical protein